MNNKSNQLKRIIPVIIASLLVGIILGYFTFPTSNKPNKTPSYNAKLTKVYNINYAHSNFYEKSLDTLYTN